MAALRLAANARKSDQDGNEVSGGHLPRASPEAELANSDLVQILVVEDDQLIQAMVEDALSEGGFEPVLAQTGEEAIELLLGAAKYAALITDINLPGDIDGWEVAKRAREAQPQMPVVYMTGPPPSNGPPRAFQTASY